MAECQTCHRPTVERRFDTHVEGSHPVTLTLCPGCDTGTCPRCHVHVHVQDPRAKMCENGHRL